MSYGAAVPHSTMTNSRADWKTQTIADTLSAAAAANGGGSSAGTSFEQQRAERVMLQLLGDQLGVPFAPRRIPLGDGVRVEVDGADPDLSILVEAWAHHGPPKVARALRDFGIEVVVVQVPADISQAVLAAQRRQFRWSVVEDREPFG